MKAVFLDTATFSPTVDFSVVKQQVKQFESYTMTSTEQVVERCFDAEIIISNKVLLDAETLGQLPKLKLICIAATGFNNVDTGAAKKLGITVTNVSGYAGTSVAQYIFAQLLQYFHNINAHNANVKQGLWPKSETFCVLGPPIFELAGKVLGIIGYGHLGQSVAQIAQAFGMQVLIAEQQGVSEIRANRLAFEQVLAQADIVSLHCPLTPNTQQLINQQSLALMKNTAILINTARGGIVDSVALKQALLNKQIAHAILDVLEQEPPAPNHPLLSAPLDNLTITAHIAWASIEAQQRLLEILADNIKGFTNGSPQNVVS